MASNAQKTPIARSLNRLAEQKALGAIQSLGKSLPCRVVAVSGSIVTVAFELTNIPYTLPHVTCPTLGPEYVRYPTQVGDTGVVISMDAYIGGISGLGGGVADLTLRGNLSTLAFIGVASTAWSPTENSNALVLYGPDGAILRDLGKTATVTVDGSGNVQIHGATSVSTDINGYGSRTTYDPDTGEFTVDSYTVGATVNTVPHPWDPPNLPPP